MEDQVHLQGVVEQGLTEVAADHPPLYGDGVPSHPVPPCNTCHPCSTSSCRTPGSAPAPSPPSPGAADRSPAGQSSDLTVSESSPGQARGGKSRQEHPVDLGGESQEAFLQGKEYSDDAEIEWDPNAVLNDPLVGLACLTLAALVGMKGGGGRNGSCLQSLPCVSGSDS